MKNKINIYYFCNLLTAFRKYRRHINLHQFKLFVYCVRKRSEKSEEKNNFSLTLIIFVIYVLTAFRKCIGLVYLFPFKMWYDHPTFYKGDAVFICWTVQPLFRELLYFWILRKLVLRFLPSRTSGMFPVFYNPKKCHYV